MNERNDLPDSRILAPGEEAGRLHDAIMNIPCHVDNDVKDAEMQAYRRGHRDARHAAAELVAADAGRRESPATPTHDELLVAQLEAVAVALGYPKDMVTTSLHAVAEHAKAMHDALLTTQAALEATREQLRRRDEYIEELRAPEELDALLDSRVAARAPEETP
jgi:hypothetical protein